MCMGQSDRRSGLRIPCGHRSPHMLDLGKKGRPGEDDSVAPHTRYTCSTKAFVLSMSPAPSPELVMA